MDAGSRQTVSHAQYGALLWHLCAKFTLEFTKTFPSEPGDKDALNARIVEILSLHLWSALKAVGTEDSAALDELHRLYLESVAKDLAPETPMARLKDDLLARYGEYFKAWKDGSDSATQPAFAAAAAARVFGQAAASLDQAQKIKFLGWVLAAMAATLKMTGDLDVRQ